MIRKWIRLSPFPLSHQPGKEIQRGNLRRKKKHDGSLPKQILTVRKRANRPLITNTKILIEIEREREMLVKKRHF